MKKIIIAAAFITTGILASCTKEVAQKPVVNFEHSTVANKKDIGTAD